MKKVLVTGNLGYVGSVLVPELQKCRYEVIGFDIGYFKNCLISKIYKNKKIKQIFKDIRKANLNDFKNIDYVVHLAALSNDPLGELKKKNTYEINFNATVNLAKLAKKLGIKKFIYISTQSIYGVSDDHKEIRENGRKNPITAYAKSKYLAEKAIKKLKSKKFHILILRPSTVFGPSPRFRSDIIVNNFIGSAIVEKKINILSDGTPWRPVVHINDLCKIIVRSLKLNILPFNGQAVNVGYKDGNFTVLELAKKISKIFKGIEICHSNKPKLDQRTYKVNFDKLYSIFGKNIITVKNFDKQCTKLKNFLIDNNFNKAKFYSYVTNRILRLKKIFK